MVIEIDIVVDCQIDIVVDIYTNSKKFMNLESFRSFGVDLLSSETN